MTWLTSLLRTISAACLFDVFTQVLAELSNLVDRIKDVRGEILEKYRSGQLFSNQAAVFRKL
jgi:hypothetical protein